MLFYIDIWLSFVENINKTNIVFNSFKDIFEKRLGMENNYLTCSYYFDCIFDAHR